LILLAAIPQPGLGRPPEGKKQAGAVRFGEVREKRGFLPYPVDIGNAVWGVIRHGAARKTREKEGTGEARREATVRERGIPESPGRAVRRR
jgi:hypothetical protein